eukprot:gene8230-9677_t
MVNSYITTSAVGVIVLLLSVVAVQSASNPNIIVNPETKRFLDTYGREVYMHGMNVIQKNPPFIPIYDHFNTGNSFSREDMINMQEWGMNVVRLGVMWSGVETAPFTYNQTYLDGLKDIVTMMADYGIYALLDCHQDLFANLYCGDGAPDHACRPTAHEKFPIPVQLEPFVNDNSTGWPSDDDCGKHSWGSYYMAGAVGSAFQSLYDNKFQVQDYFSGYWQKVAETFKDSPNVLGYELINEPWAGDVYLDPELLIPTIADKKNLAPLYERLNTDIRSVDPDHIIFFESVTWDDLGVGFEHVPGGEAYRNLSALSWHYYYPPAITIDDSLYVREKDLNKLGCAGMLTEFGDTSGDDNSTLYSSAHTMSSAEASMQGWIFWEYKYFTTYENSSGFIYNEDGVADPIRVKLFARTFAQSVSGVVFENLFDQTTGKYFITYMTNPAIQQPTVIYLNEASYYANGYNVEFSPANGATYTTAHNTVFVTSVGTEANTLTVTITPK